MQLIVIGLGSMGRRRIRILQRILPDCIIGGVDEREDRKKKCKEEYNIAVFSSLHEAIHTMQPEVALVCTSPISHAEIIMQCLKNNLHVFTEINLISDKYDEIMNMAKARELVLFLSSTPIYKQEIQFILKKMQEDIGPIHYCYHFGQYLPDWHPWENCKDFFAGNKETNGCREILAIEMPWIIKAFGNIKEVRVISDNLTNLNLGFKDSYLLQFLHEGGNGGIVAFDVVCRQPVRRLEIYNENLYLEWAGKPDNLTVKNIDTGDIEYPCSKNNYEVKNGYSELINEQGYVDELLNFLAVLRKDELPLYSFEEDKELIKLIDKIEASDI